MRILVTGAAGMLGSVLVPALQERHEVWATDLVRGPHALLDVRNSNEVMRGVLFGARPELIVHLAAITDLEAAEADPDAAWHTNALGTRNVALACQETGIPMAYVSTAGVFDGTKTEPYTEYDIPNPINVYGRSKLAGEQVVKELVPEHFICRAGWMMSGGPGKDHKFVSYIMEQIASGAEILYAVNDLYGTPTYAPDFAECFEQVIRSGRYGTYHMASPGVVSRFDIAQAIVNQLGLAIRVWPVNRYYSFPGRQFTAPRPTSEAMRNMVLDLEGNNTMRPWREALTEYLKDWGA